MPTNKNAAIRYQTLDKCFRDRQHRYYMEDLIDKCEEAIYYYNGVGGVCRRQIFEDIKFMEVRRAGVCRLKESKMAEGFIIVIVILTLPSMPNH